MITNRKSGSGMSTTEDFERYPLQKKQDEDSDDGRKTVRNKKDSSLAVDSPRTRFLRLRHYHNKANGKPTPKERALTKGSSDEGSSSEVDTKHRKSSDEEDVSQISGSEGSASDASKRNSGSGSESIVDSESDREKLNDRGRSLKGVRRKPLLSNSPVRDVEREKLIQMELERLKHEMDDGEDEVILDDDEADLIPQEEPRDRTPLLTSQDLYKMETEIGVIEIKETKKEESPQSIERRPALLALATEEMDVYCPGSIVWATSNNLRWPAMVLSAETAKQCIDGEWARDAYPVQFFGSNSYGFAKHHEVVSFDEGLQMYMNSTVPRGYKTQLKIAVEHARTSIQRANEIEEKQQGQGIKRKTSPAQEDSSASEVSRSPSPPLSEYKKLKQSGPVISGKVNRPRLGEIPELENKKVSCEKMTGRVLGPNIKCDHCSELLSPGKFEVHAGREQARNPYKTIIVTESGKCLDEYRCCTYCYTKETPWWYPGPFGDRTLCEPCGKKWKVGTLRREHFAHIDVGTASAECRPPRAEPAKTFVPRSERSNCQKLNSFNYKDFTFEKFQFYVLNLRMPVVLTNCLENLDSELWSFDFLKQKYGAATTSVRYMEAKPDDESQFGVLKDCEKTVQWFLDNAEQPNFENDPDYDTSCLTPNYRALIYAKDFSFGEIVPEWRQDLITKLPPFLIPWGQHDLLGAPPEPVRSLVWMAYVGAEGTRTPLHVDKLATIAFNLHVCGEGTKNWWLINHNETAKLEKIVAKEGGNLYKDTFWMAPTELEETNLKMWYHNQKKGEMIIVPSMVPHTVMNQGKLSCAVAANLLYDNAVADAWKAMTINKSFNRTSIYRLKNCIYHAVAKELQKKSPDSWKLLALADIFDQIVADEVAAREKPELQPDDEYFLCDKCSCDIFNRRYHCSQCQTGDYDLCVQCYNEVGKEHCHKMTLIEKIPFSKLKEMLKLVNDITEPLKMKDKKLRSPPEKDKRMTISNVLN